jgi:NAD(P)-dependent dehydrogenase (short-subunit alcohol dehydrogenase family)
MGSVLDNPFTLSGKKILITGASSGIGRQCAIRCSFSGATVIISGRDENRLQETFELLKPADHSKFTGDLCDTDNIDKLVSDILQHHGKIDGLVSSIGYELTLPVYMMKPKDYQSIFNTNVISVFELSRQLIKKNALNNNSSLVFIASIMGMLGQAGKIGYCSSKGALISGSRAMALELANSGIRVNTILPAVCKTPLIEKLFAKLSNEKVQEIVKMHPLGLGDPDDVAFASIYLLSEASRWITGSSLTVDGGYSAQ